MTHIELLELIPYGKENAISRDKLANLSGLKDREMRDCIALLRRSHAIINLQNGSGYYQPTLNDLSELDHFIKQETCRFKSIAYSLAGAKKVREGLVNRNQVEFQS